ncbi:MAG: addiction module protein [Candidatus Omnitrophica bacterium]|nr:addiction module protein [Candidatus Omnitrophota bacterium]MCA9430572.1 addiction module protein [Candidatus Omnitrophota bacterium]MCA9447676.1 addiction module protein [Candidatus Omnitrophota bacterium]MCB9766594.1 addiction module protein [Candidatus Omnitrophota bacterium]
MSNTLPDVGRLTKDERLRLIEKIWETFEEKPEDLPVTAAQRSELDARLKAMDKDDTLGESWEQVARRIRNKGT